jgi:hypothetical protein
MDRGYLDFGRLHRLHEAGSYFVTRAKSNLKALRRYSNPVDRSTGLICAQTIVLTGFYSRQDFDTPVRRIKLNDPKTSKRLVLLTNNFVLPAITIGNLSMPLASRIILQMDQAASSDQSLFRYFRERRQNSNLDRGVGLRACRHRQKAPQPVGQSLRNATDLEPHDVRAIAIRSTIWQQYDR